MNNKCKFLAIILATILALIIVFAFIKPKSSTTPIKLEENNITLPKEDSMEQVPEESIIQTEPQKVQNTVKKEVNPVTKPTIQKTIQPTVQSEEAPIIKPLQIKEEVIPNKLEEKADAGILKETDSNDIVITREFKSNTPSKYSFEGYGVQKAPTK